MTSADHLKNVLIKLFPEYNILSNVRRGSNIFSYKNTCLELDFVVSGCNLAFEYQDPSHYVTTNVHRSLSTIQELDNLKPSVLAHRGDTLITVPFWWDGRDDSLVSTIRSVRPDLLKLYAFKCSSSPIPLVPPNSLKNEDPQILPTIGELMLPSFVYPKAIDFTSWWISEKYDGIRVCWHSEQKIVYTRYVKEVPLPREFVAHFPDFFVDGEVWFGRGSYEDIHEAILEQVWDNFRILALDCPAPELQQFEFEIRADTLILGISSDHPFIINVPQFASKGRSHVREVMQRLVQTEGEGLVLRKPKMIYVGGRSDSIVKFKTHRDDEAVVVTADPPHFTLLLPNGATFSAKSPNEKKRIKVGDVVSFVPSSVTPHGIPVGSKITRVRHEFSWEEFMLSNSENSTFIRALLDDKSPIVRGHADKNIRGHWLHDDGKRIKDFMENFAKRRGFDPLVANNWYKVTTTHIREAGGGGILHHFKGSIISTLIHVFPSIGLVKSKFTMHPKFHWKSYENRKQFFEELAKDNGYDPTDVSNLYKMNLATLAAKKGGYTLLQSYGSIEKLLKDVYPNLNLEASKFLYTPNNFWKIQDNKKAFFEAFAKKRNFDPLIAQNWYNYTLRDYQKHKGANGFFKQFGGSYSVALMNVYPNIGLNVEEFRNLPQSYWRDVSNRKNFFTNLARKRDFDPTNKEKWYSITKLDVMLEKGGIAIIKFYNSSIRSALMDVYPDVDFDESKFIFVQ
eukprot:Phypoly_transcript_03709.p1 GENE.Phypoly_transcript_03709~~Phypoly_transcript_03709.p1  ORF type:complete len:736 (+),score=66.77 Phypoly_transcript_03709:154-2361(+)